MTSAVSLRNTYAQESQAEQSAAVEKEPNCIYRCPVQPRSSARGDVAFSLLRCHACRDPFSANHPLCGRWAVFSKNGLCPATEMARRRILSPPEKCHVQKILSFKFSGSLAAAKVERHLRTLHI